MTFKVHNTTTSLKHLKRAMKSSDRVFYTRFGDGEICLMGDDKHADMKARWSEGLRDELRESINIKDPNYLKAVSLDYECEKGMEPGIFAPFGNKDELIGRLNEVLKTGEKSFYQPVLFHYLACFKPQKLKNFISEFIRPKKKLFIGNCKKENMEKLFGPIDYYVEVPAQKSFDSIDEWWPKVLDCIDRVEVVLPCAGAPSNVVNARLWKMGVKVHSIDIGSVVDAMDGQVTRTWLRLKGQEIRNFFDDTLKIDIVVPYRPGNLGAAYNEAMAKADDWVLFLDHDFMLLNPKWYDICLDAIRQVGHKAGWISAVTNRIYCPTQRVNLKNRDDNNIENHISISNDLWTQYGGAPRKATDSKIPFSGFFILTHKEAWLKTGGFGDGFLGVDNDYYNKLMLAGYDSYILPGLYGYHIYKAKSLYKMVPERKPDLRIVEKEAKAPPKKDTVSVIMMVKDEEKNLHRCLSSIEGLYDELIIVDTGSTDKTMEICKEYGAKVFEHPWENFSFHRNQSVEYASGEWLFQVDADEELDWTGITPKDFRGWLFSQSEDVAGIDFEMDDMRGGRKAIGLTCRRCFRNGKGSYQKVVHNEIIISGKIAECKTLRFRHYGYDLSEEEKAAKGARSIPLLEKRLRENPADYDVYFYLCQFYVDLNDDLKGMENGEKYLKYKPFMGQKFNASIYYTMANLYIRTQRFEKAKAVIIEGLKDLPGDLDLNLVLTQFGVMTGNADIVISGAREFIQTFEKYENGTIKKGNRFIYAYNPDTLAYCHWQLSAAYLQAGLHVAGKLKEILPGSDPILREKLMEDCKTRLGPVGLYDAARAVMG